jgi:hypothetical protein
MHPLQIMDKMGYIVGMSERVVVPQVHRRNYSGEINEYLYLVFILTFIERIKFWFLVIQYNTHFKRRSNIAT